MPFSERRQFDALGRTPAQLLTLAKSILESVEGTDQQKELTTELQQLTTSDTSSTILFDQKEEIATEDICAADVELEGEHWPNVWKRVSTRLSEQYLYVFPSDRESELTQRLARVVKNLNNSTDVEFSAFLDAVDNIHVDPEILELWKFLSCIMARKKPQNAPARPLMTPIVGAQHYFEQRFLQHVQQTARRLGMPSEDNANCVRMYVHHLTQNRGDAIYPTWMLIYFSIRCGDYDAAAQFATNAVFPEGSRLRPPYRYFLDLKNREDYVTHYTFQDLEHACVQFMRTGARKKLNSEYRYMLMSIAFICGHIYVADSLISESAQSWDSLHEFLWFALGCVRPSGAYPNQNQVQYDYRRLRSRLSAFDESYYTENGQKPLRYAMVLLTGLQFGSALYYLLRQGLAKPYATHVVHMAIALHYYYKTPATEAVDPKALGKSDVADLVYYYAQNLASSRNQCAWHYYMMSAQLRDDQMPLTDQAIADAFIDMIQRSRDLSMLGTHGVVMSYLNSVTRLKQIFKIAAKRCQELRDLEIAIELFSAADSLAEAVDASNDIAMEILLECGNLHGAGTIWERTQKMKQLESIFTSSERRFGHPNEEMEVLRSIAQCLEAYYQNDGERAIMLIQALTFWPKSFVEIESKGQRIRRVLPKVLPLLPMILHILCIEVRRQRDWTEENRIALIMRIAVLVQFLPVVSPPVELNAARIELEMARDAIDPRT